MNTLKVVFITPHWGNQRTGPEVYVRYLWEAFRNDPEIEFHVVAGGVDEVHSRLHLVNSRRGSFTLFRDVSARALRLMDELGGPGILHVNNSNFHGSLLRSRWPIIGQVNDYETASFYPDFFRTLYKQGPRRLLSLWRRRILEAKFVRHQDVTLCNSDYTRKQIVQAYGISDSTRIRVLYKAVDTSGFVRPSHVTLSVREKPFVFFIGSDFRRKGLDVLIDAISLTSRRMSLRIAGVDERSFESAFPGKVAKARAWGSLVEFLGPVERERIHSLLWDSDIFCLPSRAEALGVALLEALAAGLPCVATKVGGIPEIAQLVPGVTLVEPDNPAELSKAIESALMNPSQVDSFVILNRHFGHSIMARKVKELYLEMKP